MSDPSASVRPEPKSEEGSAEASPWTPIKEHKVLQWSLAYLGAALALAHGQELLAHNFHWPEFVGRMLIGVLIAGFPVAVALAWYHGHRGMTRLSAGELTIVSLLLVIAALLLTALVRAPQEGATEVSSRSVAPTVPASSASAVRLATLPGVPVKQRLAIMPFENLSPDPGNAFFTDGLHEEILTTLANSAPELEVISRTTMISYRGRPVTVAQIAKDLGATRVLEGSVRREGNHVRLTLQLIDARTDEHLWAEDFDRTLVSAITLQSEVATNVARQLAVRLRRPQEAPKTAVPEAYDLYLKARLAQQSITAETLSRVADVEALYTQAIELDPKFALAYIGRALFRLSEPGGSALFETEAARADIDAARRLNVGPAYLLAAEGLYRYHSSEDLQGALQDVQAARAAGLVDPITDEMRLICCWWPGALRRPCHSLEVPLPWTRGIPTYSSLWALSCGRQSARESPGTPSKR